MVLAPARILSRPDGTQIAYRQRPARGSGGGRPGVMFLGGYLADMTGIKASFLDAFCRARGLAYLRFDYRGHGASSGRFDEATIGDWLADALAAFDSLTTGPQVVVGSSMGGWLSLLLAQARAERLAGLVGIAAAPDFTEDLMWPAVTVEQRAALHRDGHIDVPSQYQEQTYRVTLRFIEEARAHLVLRGPIAVACPVRLLQGMADPDVPWPTAQRIAERLTVADVRITLIKDGDHRLSRDADLALLGQAVAELAAAPAHPPASARKPSR